MSIENSFCLCDWPEASQLWKDSSGEDDFAEVFFSSPTTFEITFPEKVHYHLVSWEMLEDFSDWYRDRNFPESDDWKHFCAAWKLLGLMEAKPFEFDPVNDLKTDEESELVFGALSPESVEIVLTHLKQIDGEKLDHFMQSNDLVAEILFSEMNSALLAAISPGKGLVIFAG